MGFEVQFPPQYQTLLTVELFTGDHIGAIGKTPTHLSAWRELLILESADECFKSLVTHATLPGQLYGLAGVYFTDRSCLKSLAAPFMERNDTVATMFACVVGNTPVKDLVDKIVEVSLPEELRGAPGQGSGHGV